MSKDRLEEIKEQYKNGYKLSTAGGKILMHSDIEFLIEQAERAEELEEFYNDMLEEATILNEQNKRYREALEKANKELSYDHDDIENCARNAYHTICKALEGDPHESI